MRVKTMGASPLSGRIFQGTLNTEKGMWAASVRPFNPILSVQHSRKNILTGADFKQPRVKSLLDRLVEFLNQKVQP
ncbi:hypothetical protein Q2Q11_003190 [Escherichia coli]|nr:hypothetical protein [Escherichia coli]ELN3547017.1 hypothetical protein [Escherichia coli]ELN3561333.1 hypothetical protein [Escherichia coli]ELN3571227.1 hypothetical protein [Escherichia coli]